MLLLAAGALTSTAAEADEFDAKDNTLEVGLFGGTLITDDDHGWIEGGSTFKELADAPPEIGLRIAYLPLKYVGFEGELAGIPSATANAPALVWAARAHLIGQYPIWRFRPFALVGMGAMGVQSDEEVLGSESDGAFHWGLGTKFVVSERVGLRVDGRHVVAPQQDTGLAHHFELLLGAAISFDLSGEDTTDSDGDGVPDSKDKCNGVAGLPFDGCPGKDADGDNVYDRFDECPGVRGDRPDGCLDDSDGDGVGRRDDLCPDEAGVAPHGCVERDTDGDGVLDHVDECPSDVGVAPAGCPPKDQDGDGVDDARDQCPTKPETKNGYQDKDGCPDEVPEKVKRFTGKIEGITFEFGSADIRSTSFGVLDEAVAVLKEYQDLRIEIGGHTDNVGPAETNQQLSQARADSVRQYFLSKGIAEDRISAVGYGPTQPVAPNETKEGRAQNRRIEFNLK